MTNNVHFIIISLKITIFLKPLFLKIVTDNILINFETFNFKIYKMNISENKMVTLSYTLRSENAQGEIIEQTSDDNPLQFVYGIGMMLPKFESNLTGLKEGDDFEMSLDAIDAYGEIDNDAVVDLPKNIFIVDGHFDEARFSIGSQIPMQTNTGQRMTGTVIEVQEEHLKMDFNHPLAGVNLHFKGNIIEVREATEEELNPMMGCGGGCSSCGGHEDGCGSHDEGCGSGCCEN